MRVAMINAQDKRIAQLFKTRLSKLTPLVRLLVYGSRARGNAHPDSDLDIFIETPSVTPELRHKISELAWEIGFEHNIVISTFVVTSKGINESPIGANPILKAIVNEGIAL
jgi:predicted nucleotidyltransferase